MKYRYLTYQELDLLRDDFQDFLYQERTTHYEWKVLQDQHSKVALNLLSKYSDITFDKVMQDISYLYFNDGFEIKSFECQPEKLVVISLKSNNNTKIDINLEEELDLNTSTGLFSYKCSKSISEYDINRETSIFNLIESGCIPTDHKIFKQLSIARTVFQN